MTYEVEQKFRVDDLAAVARRLSELGAATSPVVVQVDRYFAHPHRDFAQTDEALRVRCVGDANFVTYKGPKIDATTKTRREIELPLPPGADFPPRFAELLAVLGFQPVADVRKRRRTAHVAWEGVTVEVALDEVDGVGQFVELELSAAEAEIEAARQRLRSLAQRLGLADDERRSYLELLLAG